MRTLGLRTLSVVLAASLLLTFVLAPAMSARAAPASDEIIYIVKPGDRLVDIAERHGVSASALLRANGLANPDLLYPGQRLVIPDGSSAAATPAPTPTATPDSDNSGSSQGAASPTSYGSVYHTVTLGDTMDKIARLYGVSASAIIEANGLSNPDVIYVGQKLLIPNGSEQTSKPVESAPTSSPQPAPIKETSHVVQPGDTLAKIGQKYGVSVAALVSANGLGSADLIQVGQRLVIPGKGVTKYPGKVTKFVASISQQRCWLYAGDTIISEWVCSTGRAGSNTQPGSYKIQSKLPKAYGSTWNIWMPYWLGIYWAGASENGIHGLPWNASSGIQVWTGFVGTPITYGCVMLDNVNAKMLYDAAYIGMPVIIKS